MKIVPLARAKAELSALVELVAGGEEVTITRRGEPVARLVPEHREGARGRAGHAALLQRIRESVRQQKLQPSSAVATLRQAARY